MEYLWYAVTFVFGSVIGSFLNVVIYRLHTGRSVNGRSHCLSCGIGLRWFELVPVLSYLAVGGRCRRCHAYIPIRYLLVELITGGLFVFVWYAYQDDAVLLALSAVLVSILVIVFVYDLRHFIIPDELVVGIGLCAAGILGWHAITAGSLSGLLGAVLGGIGATAFLGSLWLLSGGRWMGFGDVKLVFPLAALAGPAGAPALIVLAFWVGALVGVTLVLWQRLRYVYAMRSIAKYRRYFTMKSEIPFAPFLILGFVYVYFSHTDIFDIIAWFTF